MSRQAALLRDLFRRPGVVRIIGAHDALGAKLAERAGFDGIWSSGLEISTAHGVPDANILTMTEFLAAAQSMADASRIPVVADCDTGYGNSNNVIHMVKKFEAAGVAAVSIEDKLFPKTNSLVAGRQELAPIAEFVGKIMAAKNAQRTSDFMVIARVEALIAGWGQEEALKRAHAYARAGADAILIHSKSKTPDEILSFVRAWDFSAPLVVVPTNYPGITAQQLEQLGIKMIIYANQGLRSAIAAMECTFQEILRAGTTAPVEDRIAPMSLVFELQGYPQLKRDEETYLRTGGRRARAIIPAAGDHLNEYSMTHIAADIPVAMLDVNGKPLLKRQAETLDKAGVMNITAVGGYKSEKIIVDGVKVAENAGWQSSGEMQSILTGAGDYQDHTLVVYSDILFDSDVLEKLLKSDADITLVVDRGFGAKNYGADRRLDLVRVAQPWPDSRRSLQATVWNRVVKVGKNLASGEADCEFAGLALFSNRGFALLREAYEAAVSCEPERPFHEARSARFASLTDCLQELIDRGQDVTCISVSSGWMEIHSFDDYRLACQQVAQ